MPITPLLPPDPDAPSGIIRSSHRYVGILQWTDDAGDHRVEFESPSIVGSDPRAHIRVRHTGISRFHAEVSVRPDGIELRHLARGSRTGFRNASLKHGVVADGDELRFGEVPIRIEHVAHPERRPVSTHLAKWSDLHLEMFGRAYDLTRTNAPMEIRGPHGSAADFLATRMHALGDRRDRPFVSVDCWHKDVDESLATLIAARAGVVEWRPWATRDPAIDPSRAGTLYIRHAEYLTRRARGDLLQWLQGGRAACDIGVPDDARVMVNGDEPLSVWLGDHADSNKLYFVLSRHMLDLPSMRDRLADVPILVREIAHECGIDDVPDAVIAEATEWARNHEDQSLMGHIIDALMASKGHRARE